MDFITPIFTFFAAIPGVLLLWLAHTWNLLPWYGWLAFLAGLVAAGSVWVATGRRNDRRFENEHSDTPR